MNDDKSCSACHGANWPLVVTADGRSLCLACVEAAPDAAGVDADALALLRRLTRMVDADQRGYVGDRSETDDELRARLLRKYGPQTS